MANHTHRHSRRATNVSHTESEFDRLGLIPAEDDDDLVNLDRVLEEGVLIDLENMGEGEEEFEDAHMIIQDDELQTPDLYSFDHGPPMAPAVVVADVDMADLADMEQGDWDGDVHSVSTSSSFDHYNLPLRDTDIICSSGFFTKADHPGNVTMRRIIAQNVVKWGKATTNQQQGIIADIRTEIGLRGTHNPKFLFTGTRDRDIVYCREASEKQAEKEIVDELLLHFNIIPTENDYIFGMGKPIYNWKGNLFYRNEYISQQIPMYKRQGANRAAIRKEVMAFVASRGGRFLYPFDNSKPTGGCIVVEDMDDIEDKLDRVLRDSKGGRGKNAEPPASHHGNGPMVHHMAVAVMTTDVPDNNKKHDSFTTNPVIASPIPAVEATMSSEDIVEIGPSDAPAHSAFACASRRVTLIAAAVGVLLLLAVTIGIVMATGSKEKRGALSPVIPLDESPTLSAILDRKYLRVGVTSQQGYATVNSEGVYEGFEVDLARAVAAGIFGKDGFQARREDEPVRFFPLDPEDRFSSLNNDEIDLLLATTSQTLERTVYENTTEKGYTFSTPYLINGLIFAGLPDYLPCVLEFNATVDDICADAKICVLEGSTHQKEIPLILPDFSIVSAGKLVDFYENFKNGDCNLLAGEQLDLAPKILESWQYDGPYEVGTDVLTKELISMVTRDGDSKFSDFVNYILQSLMAAEEMGMPRTVVPSNLETTDIFGKQYETMFQDAFSVVGDYGQLYNTHLEPLVPRSPANEINLGNTAGMFSKPFGILETGKSSGLTSPTIDRIINQNRLVVGIVGAPIFAELVDANDYQGIDADFAKAVSAALFDGIVKVSYETVTSEERFQKLKDGKVDLLARVTTITMERDVKEPTTGHGFTFSTPIFHDSIRFVGRTKKYVECAENRDWTSKGCSDLKVCLSQGTTQADLMSKVYKSQPERLVLTKGSLATVEAFGNGVCQVYASGVVERSPAAIRKFYSGNYTVGPIRFSRESLALVTNEDDVVFSKLVDAVVNAIIYADEQGITQDTHQNMDRTDIFEPLVGDAMFRHVIQAVGSYQEIWDRHASPQGLEREGRNLLNTFPLGPMLTTEQTWNKRPPTEA